MSKLTDVISKINKEYKEELIGNNNIKTKDFTRIPLSTPALSYIFRGGLPLTITQILGEPSSGKSTLCYSIVGNAQRLFKEQYEQEIAELEPKTTKEAQQKLATLKERGHRKVVYVDVEYTSDDEWMTKNGVDLDDLIFLAPTKQSAEEIFQMILDIIESDGVGLVVLDSVPALTSQAAMDKTLMEKTYCGISAPMTSFCNKLLTYCNKYNTGFIFCNQPRQDISGYNRIMYNGGQMLRHTFSLHLFLKKDSFIDEDYNELKSHPEFAAGNLVAVEILKMKGLKPDRRMCKFSISYSDGIDGLNDTITMAIGLGIIERSGAWYSMGENKWQGKANVIKDLRNNKDLYNEVHNLVIEKCLV